MNCDYELINRNVYFNKKNNSAIKIDFAGSAIKEFMVASDNQAESVISYKNISLNTTGIGSPNYLAIEMDKYDYDLHEYLVEEYLNKQMRPSLAEIYDIAAKILAGVCVLHSNNIVHNDIKEYNYFVNIVDGKPNIVLADFGLSMIHIKDFTRQSHNQSYDYHAPELVYNEDYYTEYGCEVDMWSIGIILLRIALYYFDSPYTEYKSERFSSVKWVFKAIDIPRGTIILRDITSEYLKKYIDNAIRKYYPDVDDRFVDIISQCLVPNNSRNVTARYAFDVCEKLAGKDYSHLLKIQEHPWKNMCNFVTHEEIGNIFAKEYIKITGSIIEKPIFELVNHYLYAGKKTITVNTVLSVYYLIETYYDYYFNSKGRDILNTFLTQLFVVESYPEITSIMLEILNTCR